MRLVDLTSATLTLWQSTPVSERSLRRFPQKQRLSNPCSGVDRFVMFPAGNYFALVALLRPRRARFNAPDV